MTEPALTDGVVALTVVEAEDVGFLYDLAHDDTVRLQWMTQGEHVPRDRFAANMWQNTLTQFVAADAGGPFGHVSCYQADLRSGNAAIAAAFLETRGDAIGRSLALFVDYLFRTFPFRKLYAEIVDFNLGWVRGAFEEIMVEEGRLREHRYIDGRHCDIVYYALYRAPTIAWLKRYRASLAAQERHAAPSAPDDILPYLAETVGEELAGRVGQLSPDDNVFEALDSLDVAMLVTALDVPDDALQESDGTMTLPTMLQRAGRARAATVGANGSGAENALVARPS